MTGLGVSGVDEEFSSPSAGVCNALVAGGGSSCAWSKVFLTLSQKLLVKSSFMGSSRVHDISISTLLTDEVFGLVKKNLPKRRNSRNPIYLLQPFLVSSNPSNKRPALAPASVSIRWGWPFSTV